MKCKHITICLILLYFSFRPGFLMGQEGEAGIESPFSIGVGARALSLGSAGVAFPDDPTAFYWNPAGMVVVQQKGIVFSLTTLFEGTQYNFIGYVHPTISTGTFGIGVARIGTGGIKYIEDVRGVPVDMGELDYWWVKLTLAYTYTVLKGLSLGVNFDINRQVLGFYSTNGFGMDMGAHYGFPMKKGILSNIFLGCNVVHLVPPRLKLGVTGETVPYNVRGGIAKVFYFRNGADRWLFLADVVQSKHKKMKYHFGTEYAWNSAVFVRLGLDDSEISFGGGLRYKNFQLDYGTSRIGDPMFFPRSHRFSLSFYIGKSIAEQKVSVEERKNQEILDRISEQMKTDRMKRIDEGLRAGKEYMQEGDYFNARLVYGQVLRDDNGHTEASEMLKQIAEIEQGLQRQREEELLMQGREKERIIRDNAFVDQRRKEGIEALEKGDYQKAIEKWEEALQRDSDNKQIIDYLQGAREELNYEVSQLFARVEQLFRQENYAQAYKVLDQAEDLTKGNTELNERVLKERNTLDRAVNFLTNYQIGVRLYGERNYKDAARYFEKALQYSPNHTKAKWYYQGSIARAGEKKLEMTPEVKKLYYRGMDLYYAGQYEEAKKAWEEALKSDPHNLYILRAIEGANEKIETYKEKE